MIDSSTDRFSVTISFFRIITQPFLRRFSDDDKEKITLWEKKIFNLKDYETMEKYLTFLTFMIINGQLIPPFDSDPQACEIPPLAVYFEDKMLDYIQKVSAQCQSILTNETQSSDEKTNDPGISERDSNASQPPAHTPTGIEEAYVQAPEVSSSVDNQTCNLSSSLSDGVQTRNVSTPSRLRSMPPTAILPRNPVEADEEIQETTADTQPLDPQNASDSSNLSQERNLEPDGRVNPNCPMEICSDTQRSESSSKTSSPVVGQKSNSEPDGRVNPFCPKENC